MMRFSLKLDFVHGSGVSWWRLVGKISNKLDVLRVLFGIFYCQAAKLGDRAINERPPVVDTKIDGS